MKLVAAASICSIMLLTCSWGQQKSQKEAPPVKPITSEDFDRDRNPYGSIFIIEKQEDTQVEKVGAVATYKFVARNFVPSQKFDLYKRTLHGPPLLIYEYEVDDDGQLGRNINGSTMMLDNEQFLMFDFFKAEPVQYILRSKDGNVLLSNRLIPYPVEREGKDGAEVHIRRLVPDARLVICEGKDFNADEKIFISSQSAGKRTANVPVICTNGRFSMIFEPATPEKSGGTAYVEILRFNERMVLDYEWGCDAINPKRRMANTTYAPQDALLKLPTELEKTK